MNTLAFVAFCVAISGINAQYIESRALLAGPSARSSLVGPDGSHIISEVEGGAVLPHDIVAPVPEVVVRAEPLILPAPEVYPVPIVPAVHPVSYLEHGRSDIIAGPSGTIVANKDYGYTTPLVAPVHRELYVEPAVRSFYPTTYHHGLTYGHGRSLIGNNYFGYGGEGFYGHHGHHGRYFF